MPPKSSKKKVVAEEKKEKAGKRKRAEEEPEIAPSQAEKSKKSSAEPQPKKRGRPSKKEQQEKAAKEQEQEKEREKEKETEEDEVMVIEKPEKKSASASKRKAPKTKTKAKSKAAAKEKKEKEKEQEKEEAPEAEGKAAEEEASKGKKGSGRPKRKAAGKKAGGKKKGKGDEDADTEMESEEATAAPAPARKELPHDARVLETGQVFFFYRPKVDVEEAHSAKDVQRLFVLLKPSSTLDNAKSFQRNARLMVVTSKRLPSKRAERHWAFVDAVSDDLWELHSHLDKKTYETKTRGTRTIHTSEVCGEGVYQLISHKGHTVFAYVLEIPANPGEVQKSFGIKKEDAIIMQIKNPRINQPARAESVRAGLQPGQKAHFPANLQARFKGVRTAERRFIPLEPAFLNYMHAEVLMIGEGSVHGLGDELIKQLEEVEKEDLEASKEELSSLKEKPLADLGIEDEGHAPQGGAALEGRWPK